MRGIMKLLRGMTGCNKPVKVQKPGKNDKKNDKETVRFGLVGVCADSVDGV